MGRPRPPARPRGHLGLRQGAVRDLCFVWPGPIEEAVEHLQARGVAVEIGPVERPGAGGDGLSVYFRDSDGSLLEVISYA